MCKQREGKGHLNVNGDGFSVRVRLGERRGKGHFTNRRGKGGRQRRMDGRKMAVHWGGVTGRDQ